LAQPIDSEDLVRKAAEAALDKKATDVVILDLRKVSEIADFFLLASAINNRQLDSIKEAIVRSLKKERKSPPVEGQKDWILIDYGDVIIHLFTEETRQFYQIERLWKDAKTTVMNDEPAAETE
jgi:ribosome-associated protein